MRRQCSASLVLTHPAAATAQQSFGNAPTFGHVVVQHQPSFHETTKNQDPTHMAAAFLWEWSITKTMWSPQKRLLIEGFLWNVPPISP